MLMHLRMTNLRLKICVKCPSLLAQSTNRGHYDISFEFRKVGVYEKGNPE